VIKIVQVRSRIEMAEEKSSSDGPKLSEIYDDIWKTYEFLEDCEESTSSDAVQVDMCLLSERQP
jgi:hypothetical protein